jgi:hypothetical protein
MFVWIKKLKACEVFEMGIEIVETSREDMGVLMRHIEESPEMIKEKPSSTPTPVGARCGRPSSLLSLCG